MAGEGAPEMMKASPEKINHLRRLFAIFSCVFSCEFVAILLRFCWDFVGKTATVGEGGDFLRCIFVPGYWVGLYFVAIRCDRFTPPPIIQASFCFGGKMSIPRTRHRSISFSADTVDS